MSKRKAPEPRGHSPRKRSSSTPNAGEALLPIGLAASTPGTIASMLLSLIPEGATKQHDDAKKLLKAFDLVGERLNHNANKLARKVEAIGAANEFFFHNEQITMPQDIFLHILEYLPKPAIVHRASMVCKPWLSATKTPWLWSKMTQNCGFTDKMNMSTLLRVLARPQFSCLKVLALPRKTNFSKTTPKELARLCPLLEELDVGCPMLDPRDVGWSTGALADEQLVELPTHFPHLIKIRFHMYKATNMGASSFVEKMADRLLEFYIRGSARDAVHGHLSDSTFIQIARFCPNLARFAYCIPSQYYGACDALSETGVMAVFRGCTKLKHLLLIGTQNVGLEAFELIANTSRSSLSHLIVLGVRNLFGTAEADHVRSRLEEHIENAAIDATNHPFYDVRFRRAIA